MSNESYIIQTAMKYGVRIDFKDGVITGWCPSRVIIDFFVVCDIEDLAKAIERVVNDIEESKQ